MPRKQKQDRNLDVDTKAKNVLGKHVAVKGSIVKGPVTGNQKVRMKIESIVGDETVLLIGAETDSRTRKK